MARQHLDDASHPGALRDANTGHSIAQQGEANARAVASQGAAHANTNAAYGQSVAAARRAGQPKPANTKSKTKGQAQAY